MRWATVVLLCSAAQAQDVGLFTALAVWRLAERSAQPPLVQTMREWLPRRIREPGEVQMYANFGYGLLGAVLEDVTGERYESFMWREMLEPLGMQDSTFEQPLPQALRDRVVPATDRPVFGRIGPAPALPSLHGGRRSDHEPRRFAALPSVHRGFGPEKPLPNIAAPQPLPDARAIV